MRTRQSSSPVAEIADASESSGRPNGVRHSWWATLGRAVLLYLALLLVVYMLVVAWALIGSRIGVAQPSGAVSWPDALAYPLSFAPGQTPPWLEAALALGLVLAFAACVAVARSIDTLGQAALAVGQTVAPTVPPVAAHDVPMPAAEVETRAGETTEAAPDPAQDESAAVSLDRLPLEAPTEAVASTEADAAPSGDAPAETATPVHGFVPRVFISHSSGDNAFGLMLERRLKDALGEDAVFYDADGGLHASDDWLTRLQYEIGTRNVFVLILSPQAFASGWVAKELRYALRRAVSVAGMVIVPVLHQPTDVWPFLSEYQQVDFQAPAEDAPLTPDARFEQGFAELLYAVELGRSRIDELERMRQIRQGPPYDVAELPIPERFVGRAAAVQWTLDQLAPEEDDAPPGGLASIAAANGLGGIGKSALAGQVARILYATNRFPGGIAVVRCNDLTDPATVLRRVLARFDEQRAEPDEAELRGLSDLARQVFARRRALVILDNVEADWPVEEVVRPLRAAGAAVLLTSRVRLPASAVPTEASRMLEILSPDEAIDLFAEYYGRGAKQDLTLAEQGQVGRIVKALGCHTLAVTLAAARAKGRDLELLARDYEADPRLGVNLKDGTQAVRAMLDSSLAALSGMAESGPRLFALLAAFATPEVGRRAALSVAEELELPDPRASLEALTDLRLADAFPNPALPPEADRERLRLHPLVRTYAEEQLATWDAQDHTRASAVVALWYEGYANQTSNAGKAADENNIVGALRVAHEYARDLEVDRLMARICNGMGNFWLDTGRTRAALEYLPWGIEAGERVANETQERDDRLRLANIASYYADSLLTTGQIERAERVYREDLRVRTEIGDRRGEAVAVTRLGQVAQARGRLEEAQTCFERSLAIALEVEDRQGAGQVLNDLGQVAEARGQVVDAQAYFQLSLVISQEVSDRTDEGVALNNLSQVARARGRLDEAQGYLERSLAILQEVGNRAGEGTVLNNLGEIAQHRGRLEEAQRYLERSLAIRQEVGYRAGEGVTLNNLGQVAQARGRLDEAQAYYTRSVAIARETEYAELERVASDNLAAVIDQQRAAGDS